MVAREVEVAMPNTLAVGNMHVHVADHATHGQQCLVYWLPITDTSMKPCISSTQSVMPSTLATNSVVTCAQHTCLASLKADQNLAHSLLITHN